MNVACNQIKEEFQKNDAVCSHVLNLIQLMSSKARFRIICMLVQGEFCVQEITETVNQGKLSNISQQLRILNLAGLVRKRRVDRHIRYSLKDTRLRGLIKYLRNHYLEKEPKP